jgi:hypothetical protein
MICWNSSPVKNFEIDLGQWRLMSGRAVQGPV